ncbi:dimethylarginine dimethylaminohydrolase family protein [Bacteroidota bacterium]
MFTRAIVRTPCKNILYGLRKENLGVPDYYRALEQHKEYISALNKCGLDVTVLDADENHPDSTFVEDTAFLTPYCAVITNPGAPSRKGETIEIKEVLKNFFDCIEEIYDPGTVDAGDIMMVEGYFYVGLSGRTNQNGSEQLSTILKKYNINGESIKLKNALHLKSGIAYLDNNNLITSGEFLNRPEFRKFNILEIESEESYAANCLWINGKVLVPEGFPKTRNLIESRGYATIEIDVSEFQKLDGGLSCLSLRY